MFAALLGLLDVVSAVLLVWPDLWYDILFVLGIFYILKGASTVLGALGNLLFSLIGVVDLLVGLCFIFNFSIPFLWLVLLLWGLYCLLTGW